MPDKLVKKKILQKILGERLYEFIFGSKYSSEEFEMNLKTIFGADTDFMDSVVHNSLPKVKIFFFFNIFKDICFMWRY